MAQGPSGVPPRQERSRASTERVLEATTALIAERGVDKVTVAEVARHAQVSVGAIYGRFGDKESLMRAVQQRFLERAGGIVADRLAVLAAPGGATGVREVSLALVRLAADVFSQNEALIGQFMTASGLGTAMRQEADGVFAAVQAQIRQAMVPYVRAIHHPDPEMAADVVTRTVIATLERRVMSGPRFLSDRPLSWDELADELGELVVRYLDLR